MSPWSLANHSEDWDSVASSEYPNLAARAEVFQFEVDPSQLHGHGALYADSGCSEVLNTTQVLPASGEALYFQPAADEYSTGAPEWGRATVPANEPTGTYASIPWTVSDQRGGVHSAKLRVRVSPDNDRPVARDGSADVRAPPACVHARATACSA